MITDRLTKTRMCTSMRPDQLYPCTAAVQSIYSRCIEITTGTDLLLRERHLPTGTVASRRSRLAAEKRCVGSQSGLLRAVCRSAARRTHPHTEQTPESPLRRSNLSKRNDMIGEFLAAFLKSSQQKGMFLREGLKVERTPRN